MSIKTTENVIGVTGADGFIGKHLLKLLSKNNEYRIVAFQGDLLNEKDIENFYAEGVTTVVHLAGGFFGSFNDLININLVTTQNILVIGKKFGLRKIIYSSSGAVYGNTRNLKSYENDNFISSRVSGLRQGLKFENSQILVSTYQSIEEMDSKVRAGLLSQYSALCVDEVHISGFDKFIKKCVNLKFRFGVTGTIHEIKESLFRLYQYFGDVYELTDYKSMSQAGFVVDVNVNAVKLNYDTAAVSRYKSSFRHFMAETAEDKFSPNKFYNFEHNFIAAAGYKTKFACDLALALASKGHNVFLLFQTDTEYLLEVNRELNKFVDVKLAYGPTPIHEREAIVQQLESSNGNIVTCSVVFSTGTNILNLHDVILMRIGKSKNFTLQSIGRGMRTCEGKDCVNVWDIVDVLPPMKSAEEAECYSVEHYNKRLHFYKAQGYNIKNIEVQLPSYDVGNYIN